MIKLLKRLNTECPVSATRPACRQGRKKCSVIYGPIKKTNVQYILMVEGKHLDHPKLEMGERARMKILRIDPKKDLPLKTIEIILKKALDLYRNGIIK